MKFTDLIKEHDWPPGFVSRIIVDPKTKRFMTSYEMSQQCRRNGGFDQHGIGLPGAAEHVENWKRQREIESGK